MFRTRRQTRSPDEPVKLSPDVPVLSNGFELVSLLRPCNEIDRYRIACDELVFADAGVVYFEFQSMRLDALLPGCSFLRRLESYGSQCEQCG